MFLSDYEHQRESLYQIFKAYHVPVFLLGCITLIGVMTFEGLIFIQIFLQIIGTFG